MKIGISKKQLAQIIHENGGWRDGAEFSAQDQDGEVFGYCQKPRMGLSREVWGGDGCTGPWAAHVDTVRNWHQTILSRDEYFRLYPAPDADVGSLSAAMDLVTDENKHEHVDSKPTIEQLATDYRNAKDYAERKQQEADAAKADAEAKLAELVAAGKALGLGLSVAEPELVITDWRDLQLGDVIEYVDGRNENRVGMVGRIDSFDLYNADTDRHVRMVSDNGQVGWPTKWRFIRRPAQGGDNA